MLNNNDKVFAEDEYKIFDKLAIEMNKHPGRGPIGWVLIFLTSKNGLIYDEGSNLVCAQGREFVAQKIFNTIAYDGGVRPDLRNYVITHCAIGKGGSNISSGGDVILNGPFICDTQLYSAIDLGLTDALTEPSGITNAVKPITEDGGSTVLEMQTFDNSLGGGTGTCNNYTKVRNICIIPSSQPLDLDPGSYVKVDEAALYFTLNTGGVYSDPKLFSHICFAPKWKEKESTLTIVWYILC